MYDQYNIECGITVIKLTDTSNIKSNFDFEHLKSIHKHVFDNAYESENILSFSILLEYSKTA